MSSIPYYDIKWVDSDFSAHRNLFSLHSLSPQTIPFVFASYFQIFTLVAFAASASWYGMINPKNNPKNAKNTNAIFSDKIMI
jgi:hypothetical protein